MTAPKFPVSVTIGLSKDDLEYIAERVVEQALDDNFTWTDLNDAEGEGLVDRDKLVKKLIASASFKSTLKGFLQERQEDLLDDIMEDGGLIENLGDEGFMYDAVEAVENFISERDEQSYEVTEAIELLERKGYQVCKC